MLLVDAARFQREHFQEVTPIRRKLDEPDPVFGIPARMYDTVQKSLTSPRHAWHLYHAIQYFQAHRGALRAADFLRAPADLRAPAALREPAALRAPAFLRAPPLEADALRPAAFLRAAFLRPDSRPANAPLPRGQP